MHAREEDFSRLVDAVEELANSYTKIVSEFTDIIQDAHEREKELLKKIEELSKRNIIKIKQ